MLTLGLRNLAAVAVRDPFEAWLRVEQRLAPSRLTQRLARLGRKQGLSKPAFVMSFDCDTDLDIGVGWEVHARLSSMGVSPVYAVPGENLERGAAVWRRIAQTGAEFLNHGHREHTVHRDGRYVSTVFYHDLTDHEVEDDIVRGHETVTRITGRAPEGFRTPHFGTYQAEIAVKRLHAVLKRLDYRYSTSTIPSVALRRGPFTRHFGLTELPVTGCPDYPLTILDSYCFRFGANGHGMEGYVEQMRRWSDLLASGDTYFVNLYADPSQVADWPEFFTAVELLAPFARGSYRQLLDELAR